MNKPWHLPDEPYFIILYYSINTFLDSIRRLFSIFYLPTFSYFGMDLQWSPGLGTQDGNLDFVFYCLVSCGKEQLHLDQTVRQGQRA